MMRYSLISNGAHNPFLKMSLPEHMKYPIAQNYKGQKDLDYTSLLLGDGYIMDEFMYEGIINSAEGYLNPMKHSLRVLRNEGLLELRDYSVTFLAHRNKITEMTRAYLDDLETWVKLAQIQWKSLKPELISFQAEFGREDNYGINTCNMGIENWLTYSDQTSNHELRSNLYSLFEGRIGIEEVDEEDIIGSLLFIVSQIVMSDLVSHETKAPVLDWDDCSGMYQQVYRFRWNSHEDEIELKTRNDQAFKILSYIAPDLLPCKIEDVVQFIRYDNAVRSLRESLLQLIENGGEVDDAWFAGYFAKALSKSIAHEKRKTKLGIVGAASSLAPLPWPLSAIPSIGATIASETIGREDTEYNWICALMSKA